MRTNVVQNLLRTIKNINAANRNGVSDVEDFFATQHLPRRKFLQQSALLGAGALLPSCTFFSEKTQPKVSIIGAGIAGLNAAWVLKQAGIKATIYEAGYRIGGRIFTQENLLGAGLTTEMGAEFIDTNHEEMWRLIKQFNLETIDLNSEKNIVPETYFFDGKHYSDKDLIESLKPIADKLQTDTDAVQNDKKAYQKFDYISLEQYLESLGVSGWLKELFHASFTSEYGRDCDQQSSLNMLTVLSSDFSHNQFSMYGESDERFKIKGGNNLIIKRLEQELKEQIKTGHTLVQVEKKANNAYSLTFLGGKDSIVNTDIVIFALPFTKLRNVNLSKAQLPENKLNAIKNYQLGLNGKILMGFNTPVWRNQQSGAFLGNAFTDQFICGWDNSLLQGKNSAGYTVFYGGRASEKIGNLDDKGLKNRFVPEMNTVFEGAKEAFNDKIYRYHWAENDLSQGSYTCFAPGQYTEILPYTQPNVDSLFFAGEHCSDAFQGFMNGGAQTGREAAEAVLKLIKR
jgi:monoamine oxidase